MSSEVDRMFEPSWVGWMSLLPQRIRSGGKKEDPTFMERFQQMVQVRNNLRQIERAITKWTKSMSELYGAAKRLGAAVETDDQVIKDASWNGDILMKDDSALQNIREKISMIDALIAQKTKLKYMRLKGDHAEYKLEQLRKKQASESFERQSQKYLSIKQESERQREEIMQQILVVVEKYVSQATEYGVSDLVKPQLQAFKLSQFHMFLNCQKLVQGKQMDEGLKELEEHWTNFTSKIANEIPNAQAGGSFDGSAMFLRQKLGGSQLGKISDFTDDNEDDEGGDLPSNTPAAARKAPPNEGEPLKKDLDNEVVPGKVNQHTAYRDSDFDGEDLTDLDSHIDPKAGESDDEDDDDYDDDTVA